MPPAPRIPSFRVSGTGRLAPVDALALQAVGEVEYNSLEGDGVPLITARSGLMTPAEMPTGRGCLPAPGPLPRGRDFSSWAREDSMTNAFALAALWLALAVLSTILANHLRVSMALVEICVGLAAGAVAEHFFGPDSLGAGVDWLRFLATTGAVVLTFLAGAELEPKRALVLHAAHVHGPYVRDHLGALRLQPRDYHAGAVLVSRCGGDWKRRGPDSYSLLRILSATSTRSSGAGAGRGDAAVGGTPILACGKQWKWVG